MGIQKQDLRIGNWIFDAGDEQRHFQIEQICKDSDGFSGYYVVFRNGSFKSLVTSDLIEPIPLTPEILEKCGFELYDKYFGTMLQHKHLKCRYITEEINGNKISIPFLRFDATGRPPFTKTDVYYLHQLQNIYLALTGEELEVKL